jgi:hypothetical protein
MVSLILVLSNQTSPKKVERARADTSAIELMA